MIDFIMRLLGLFPKPTPTFDGVTRLQDEKVVETGPTIIYMKRHTVSRGTKLAECRVSYDPWGIPSVIEPAYGDRLELQPNGRTAYCLGEAEWIHKSGPLVRFPSEAERSAFFPRGS